MPSGVKIESTYELYSCFYLYAESDVDPGVLWVNVDAVKTKFGF